MIDESTPQTSSNTQGRFSIALRVGVLASLLLLLTIWGISASRSKLPPQDAGDSNLKGLSGC